MIKISTYIEGLYVIKPTKYSDSRGWFMESYNKDEFARNGISVEFIQDNHSYSLPMGVLRGIHFQNAPFAQSKLIRCTRGRIFDVAVDLRKSSPTYLKWFSIILDSNDCSMLFVPQGFGHAFLTLEENTEVQYKVDQHYVKVADRSIKYNDPSIGIEWPYHNPIASEKDHNAVSLLDSDVNFI